MLFSTAKLYYLTLLMIEIAADHSVFFQTSKGHELSIPMPGHAITAKGSYINWYFFVLVILPYIGFLSQVLLIHRTTQEEEQYVWAMA